MSGKASAWAFALASLALAAVAHDPPECTQGRSGDACRDFAPHGEHPYPWDCPKDEGPQREACRAQMVKLEGSHPAIWRCPVAWADDPDEVEACRALVRMGRAWGYKAADLDCSGLRHSRSTLASLDESAFGIMMLDGMMEALIRELCVEPTPKVGGDE